MRAFLLLKEIISALQSSTRTHNHSHTSLSHNLTQILRFAVNYHFDELNNANWGKLCVNSCWLQAALPAHVVCFTDPQLSQAVGLLLVLVGTGWDNGLPAALGAGRVGARTEEQLVGVVSGNAVKELPQSLVALRSVTRPRAGRRLDAGGHVLRTQLLTRVVYVARLGGVQAAVDRRHFRLCRGNKTQMRG